MTDKDFWICDKSNFTRISMSGCSNWVVDGHWVQVDVCRSSDIAFGGDFRRVTEPEDILAWVLTNYMNKILNQYENLLGEAVQKHKIHAPLEAGDLHKSFGWCYRYVPIYVTDWGLQWV